MELTDWLGVFAQMSEEREGRPLALRQIMERIRGTCRLTALPARDDQDWAACGMAVLDGTIVGLFNLVTDPARRRQGYGSELARSLLGWAATQGALEAYLQVVFSNGPAMAMYGHLGFTHAYDYWYRVRERT
jgi:GNAT superfamily N-acetyltransferase